MYVEVQTWAEPQYFLKALKVKTRVVALTVSKVLAEPSPEVLCLFWIVSFI